jgi:glutamine cyclotransferase
MNKLELFICIWLSVFLLFVNADAGNEGKKNTANNGAVRIRPVIISKCTHDQGAFTQGLVYHKDKIYESTGLYGESSLRILDTNCNILKKVPVLDVFAEGCAIVNNKIYQISWREFQCIVYNLPDLTYCKIMNYTGEGWGLTSKGTTLIMSNGSDTLFFRDTTFKVIKKIAVTLNNNALRNINELEYARGRVYANVWFDNNIYEIDTLRGRVLRVIDCSAIIKDEQPLSTDHVLNGIAYKAADDLFLITGKKWKYIYTVKIPK